jgi:hypothetical protein
MAVESQLANLDPALVADSAVFMMDDNFLLLPLPRAAFHTPLAGPVLRLQPDLLVAPPPRGKPLAPANGEWRGLHAAATHLSARFGERARPYLGHFARGASLALLHEAALAFPRAWHAAARARFRGLDAADPEPHTLWLATQFVVERHREALLWSWAVAKWGGRGGVVSADNKARMWAELGGKEGSDRLTVGLPVRRSKEEMRRALRLAAVGPPEPDSGDNHEEVGGRTHYAHLSADGYPYAFLDLPKRFPAWRPDNGWADLGPRASAEEEARRPADVCTLAREECLGSGAEGAQELFVRVLRDRPRCGDCIVTALVGRSGPVGLEAFLPPPSSRVVAGAGPEPEPEPAHLPLALDARTAFLPADPRAFALRLLQRYGYALGATPARFFGVTSAPNAAAHLRKLAQAPDVALLCVNDDIAGAEKVPDVERTLEGWFGARWAEKMAFERA